MKLQENYNYYKFYSIPTNNRLTPLSFRGNNFFDQSKENIWKQVKESVIPDNFIGQGGCAEVYKIKGTEYCVRIPYESKDLYLMNYSRELSSIDKVNHVIAKLGFGSAILKYFEGICPKYYQNNEQERYKFQSKIANLPVESYHKLLQQIADGINNDMLFDNTGGNLIVDFNNNKMTAIDFYEMPVDNPRPILPLREIHSVLTCYGTKPDISKNILKKIILSALEEFKPDVIPCMNIELFDFDGIINKVLKHDKKDLVEKFEKLKQIKKLEIRDKSHIPELRSLIKELINIIKVC